MKIRWYFVLGLHFGVGAVSFGGVSHLGVNYVTYSSLTKSRVLNYNPNALVKPKHIFQQYKFKGPYYRKALIKRT